FFVQAEDGIRDRNVTGVQTCALPISKALMPAKAAESAPRKSTRAEGDGSIEVTVDKITNSSVSDPETQLQVGQKARVEGSWKATSTLSGGETFSVGFPSELKIPAGFSFDMAADGSGEIDEGTVIGQCEIGRAHG